MRGHHVLGPTVQLQGRDGADVLGQVRLPPHEWALPPLVLLDLECMWGGGEGDKSECRVRDSVVGDDSGCAAIIVVGKIQAMINIFFDTIAICRCLY